MAQTAYYVNGEAALAGLSGWLAERRFNRVKPNLRDGQGHPMIGLIFEKPGGRGERVGVVTILKQGLEQEAASIVSRACAEDGGW